jgi:hypothetical protein
MSSLLYGEVFRGLNKARVKYVIAGGYAVNLHGYARYTADLDIIVDLGERNLGKLFDALGSAGYGPKVPVTKEQFVSAQQRKEWQKKKNMIVFSFVELKPPFKLIDMFIDPPVAFDEVFRDSEIGKLDGARVRFLGIRHLIQFKLLASRFKDLQDIAQLRAIERGL